MAPVQSKISAEDEDSRDKLAQAAPHEESESPSAQGESSKPSSPGKDATSQGKGRRKAPCLACIDHLIGWMPSDEGVMFCDEGTSSKICVRCEHAGIECKVPTGALKGPATRLQTSLSRTLRDSEAIKWQQGNIRTSLEEKTRVCEDNRDLVAGELGEKMGDFLKDMRREQRMEGFQRGMDLAVETVRGCKGSCHCLLKGCTMGTKAALFMFSESEVEDERVPKAEKGKKAKRAKA